MKFGNKGIVHFPILSLIVATCLSIYVFTMFEQWISTKEGILGTPNKNAKGTHISTRVNDWIYSKVQRKDTIKPDINSPTLLTTPSNGLAERNIERFIPPNEIKRTPRYKKKTDDIIRWYYPDQEEK